MAERDVFSIFTLNRLISIFVNSMDLGEGIKVKRHRYWYDPDKRHVVIQMMIDDGVGGYSDDEEDDDGGEPVIAHRKPFR